MKITLKELKRIIKEEQFTLGPAKEISASVRSTEDVAKDVKETDAAEMAGALEHQTNWMKALKIQETKLIKELNTIRKAQQILKQK